MRETRGEKGEKMRGGGWTRHMGGACRSQCRSTGTWRTSTSKLSRVYVGVGVWGVQWQVCYKLNVQRGSSARWQSERGRLPEVEHN